MRIGLALLLAVTLVLLVGYKLNTLSPADKPPEIIVEVTPSPTPIPTPEPDPSLEPELPMASKPGLHIGITEFNPNFVWPASSRPDTPAPWSTWRDALWQIKPRFFRLVVDWRSIQPTTEPANLAMPQSGCVRATQPCLGSLGLEEQLQALAAAQKAAPGYWQTLVVFTDMPEWAAKPASGCEKEGITDRSRALRKDAVDDYQKLVREVIALGRKTGAELTWFSPWNEPNHPYFISPQHKKCKDIATSNAVKEYVVFANAMREVLDTEPGAQGWVLGELAGFADSKRYSTGAGDFYRQLPKDLLCQARVFSQHYYAKGSNIIDDIWQARQDICQQTDNLQVWITETGSGFPDADLSAAQATQTRLEGCQAQNKLLRRWRKDERITIAFQYTMREDDMFQVGLVTTDLTQELPAYKLWLAWANAGGQVPKKACQAD